MTMQDKIDMHYKLCQQLHETYIEKNRRYGDSVSIVRKELGPLSSLTRLYDK